MNDAFSETVRIIEANLDDLGHQAAVLELTRSYAREPIGNDGDLPIEVQRVLVERLRAHPTTIIMLAFDDERPIGIATCFLGFLDVRRPTAPEYPRHSCDQACSAARRWPAAARSRRSEGSAARLLQADAGSV
jgi:hypothetical protein